MQSMGRREIPRLVGPLLIKKKKKRLLVVNPPSGQTEESNLPVWLGTGPRRDTPFSEKPLKRDLCLEVHAKHIHKEYIQLQVIEDPPPLGSL